MHDYTNVYAGQDAIQVMPWVLARVELLSKAAVPYANSAVLRASLCSNEGGSPQLIHAIPSGFITGTFMELDIFNDAELAKFCEKWGMVAAPCAGSVARMTARLVNAGAERALLEKALEEDGEDLTSCERIDCERYGREVWYAGQNGAARELIYGARLENNNWMRSFNHATTAKGSEVLNAYHFVNAGADNCTLVYADEVRYALAIMRIAVLANGFFEKAGGNPLRAFRLAVKHDDINQERCGRRPFEEALSLFMDTDFLHPDKRVREAYASKEMYDTVCKSMASKRFKVIEENTMLFADLCLSSIPEPLVVHGGFRRGELAGLKMPDAGGNIRYGNLLQAMAAQLYAYLSDGNPWAICEVCGRPFKYEQQLMSPITSESRAQRAYQRRHRPTKTAFCSKRHEKKVYSLRNAENEKLMEVLVKIRAEGDAKNVEEGEG